MITTSATQTTTQVTSSVAALQPPDCSLRSQSGVYAFESLTMGWKAWHKLTHSMYQK